MEISKVAILMPWCQESNFRQRCVAQIVEGDKIDIHRTKMHSWGVQQR